MSANDLTEDEMVENMRRLANEKLRLLDRLQEWKTTRSSGAEDSRAFVIEFAGLPKAGKSGAIDIIRHYFTYGSKGLIKVITRPYRIYTPAEGVSHRTPGYLKENLLDYNCWAGAYSLQELLEANHDNYHDLVILDRGPWDTGCWIEYLRTAKISLFKNEEEASKIGAFFQLSHWMTQSDLHVVFVVDPAEAASREKADRLIEHQGPASNQGLMNAMRDIYSQRFIELQRAKACECPHVGDKAAVLIDTTGRHRLDVAWQVIESTFAVLDAKIAYRAKFTFTELLDRFIPTQLVRPRKDHIAAVRAFIPEVVARANDYDPSRRGRLRDRLASVVPSPVAGQEDELLLYAAQLEAPRLISHVRRILKSLDEEDNE
jgi:hypothetical protein